MDVRPGYKQTEVGVIPEDWDVKPMAELFTFQNGVNADKSAYGSGIPFINVLEVITHSTITEDRIPGKIALSAQAINTFAVQHGDVLFNRTSETQEEVGLASVYTGNESVVFGGFVIRARPRNHRMVSSFTSYALRSPAIRFQIVARGQGAVRANIGQQDLSRVQIVLPAKAEQEAIAEVLSDADALIESLEQLIAKKRHVKQGAMQGLLSGKRRLPGFETKPGYKQTEVGVIPEDWQLRPLLTVVRVANGQVDPRIEPYRSMILVGPEHIESATGRLLQQQTAGEQRAISGKYLVKRGDIVYGKINPYLKKVILADFEGLCSADMYPLKPVADVAAGFVFAAILGDHFSKYAESVSVRSGMPKINRIELAEYKMPLPPTKAEQTAIATILSDMDAEIAALEAKLGKARQIKQGMMQELLTGRIRLVGGA